MDNFVASIIALFVAILSATGIDVSKIDVESITNQINYGIDRSSEYVSDGADVFRIVLDQVDANELKEQTLRGINRVDMSEIQKRLSDVFKSAEATGVAGDIVDIDFFDMGQLQDSVTELIEVQDAEAAKDEVYSLLDVFARLIESM